MNGILFYLINETKQVEVFGYGSDKSIILICLNYSSDESQTMITTVFYFVGQVLT